MESDDILRLVSFVLVVLGGTAITEWRRRRVAQMDSENLETDDPSPQITHSDQDKPQRAPGATSRPSPASDHSRESSMGIYLCSVSPKAPENYQIGLTARTWGVKESYERHIRQTRPGDTLVFIADREFRSIHRIENPALSGDFRGSRLDHRPGARRGVERTAGRVEPLTRRPAQFGRHETDLPLVIRGRRGPGAPPSTLRTPSKRCTRSAREAPPERGAAGPPGARTRTPLHTRATTIAPPA